MHAIILPNCTNSINYTNKQQIFTHVINL